MKKYRIGLLTGDGTGPLFCSSSKTILSGLAERFGFKVSFEELPFGKNEYLQNGNPLPSKTIDGIRKADASILFAVDGSEIPGPTPVGRLRKELGFYAEVRAVRSVPGYREGIDLVFVRELTEGFLCDRNTPSGRAEWKVDDDTAFSLRVIRRGSSSRIASYAFSYAKDMGYKKVTAVHKASIFKYTCGLFLECCREEAKKYPDIIYEEMTADDVAGDLVTNPEKFGVVLTTNMFGDILSDEGAALVGGICAGINIGEESVLFMPVRHSASYDAIKTDSFDCRGALCCIVEMLKHLGEKEASDYLYKKMISVSKTGKAYLSEMAISE